MKKLDAIVRRLTTQEAGILAFFFVGVVLFRTIWLCCSLGRQLWGDTPTDFQRLAGFVGCILLSGSIGIVLALLGSFLQYHYGKSWAKRSSAEHSKYRMLRKYNVQERLRIEAPWALKEPPALPVATQVMDTFGIHYLPSVPPNQLVVSTQPALVGAEKSIS